LGPNAMDWPSLLLGFLLAILGNLLTPSVRLALISSLRWVGLRVNRLSEKGLRLRLEQLENDLTYVLSLKNNPVELIGLVVQSVMPFLFVIWFFIVIVYFIASSGGAASDIPKVWYGAIGGIVGFGTRWFLGAMIAWGYVEKVIAFEAFEMKNLANRQQAEILLKRSSGKE